MNLCKAKSNYGNEHEVKDGRCVFCGMSSQPVWSGLSSEKVLRKDDAHK